MRIGVARLAWVESRAGCEKLLRERLKGYSGWKMDVDQLAWVAGSDISLRSFFTTGFGDLIYR